MAVFTPVSRAEVVDLLTAYDIGECHSLKEISAGIENTNYFLDTRSKDGSIAHWVLTIFENIDAEELPFFCDLTAALAASGLKVPAPKMRLDQSSVFVLQGKGAISDQASAAVETNAGTDTLTSSGNLTRTDKKYGVIVPRFTGSAKTHPSVEDCAAVGAWLGKMHRALENFSGHRDWGHGPSWMQGHADALRASMPEADYQDLEQAIADYHAHLTRLERCPKGIVHGDLFRDNVLFEGANITGVIDFYNASDAYLIYDLAVAVNDWCTNEQGEYRSEACQAMQAAYQSVRPFTDDELATWHYALELAALRFWVSRLVSQYSQGYQSQAVLGDTIKDPNEMKRIMLSARSFRQPTLD